MSRRWRAVGHKPSPSARLQDDDDFFLSDDQQELLHARLPGECAGIMKRHRFRDEVARLQVLGVAGRLSCGRARHDE